MEARLKGEYLGEDVELYRTPDELRGDETSDEARERDHLHAKTAYLGYRGPSVSIR
jgi:hypothetical protein